MLVIIKVILASLFHSVRSTSSNKSAQHFTQLANAAAIDYDPFQGSFAKNTLHSSKIDGRRYFFTHLPRNNLRVVVISSPDSRISGASLAVSHGYFNDPEHLPGLAHLYEHLVLSSVMRRQRNLQQKSKLLQQVSNGFTDEQQTTFYFSASLRDLYYGLQILARSVLMPSFNDTYIKQELQAVHEEYCMNLHNDVFKEEQLLKHVSNHRHPYHIFGLGNKYTLNKTNLKEKLHFLRKRLFSANLVSTENLVHSILRLSVCIKFLADFLYLFCFILLTNTWLRLQ